MALVITTVLSASSRSRSGPQTCNGATLSWSPPRALSRRARHSTSVSPAAAIRSATSKTSCTQALACAAAASSELFFPKPESTARAESRTSTSAALTAPGGGESRPSGHAWTASRSASAASARSWSWSPSTWRPALLAARSTIAGDRSAVAAWVTLPASSWASSTTTVS